MIWDDRGGGFSWIFDLECQQTYLDVMLDHNAWHFCRKLDGVCLELVSKELYHFATSLHVYAGALIFEK